jgi:hypothetical protein
MPGPNPLKRVPIWDTRTPSRSGRTGASGGPLLHQAQLPEQGLVLLTRLLQQSHGNPQKPHGDFLRFVAIGVDAGPCHAGQVEPEAAVGDAHGCDREIDRQLEPHDLAAVDRLHPPVRCQGVEQGEAPAGGRFLAVFLNGREGGIAVGHVNPDPVRKGVQGDAHRGCRVQHGVGDQF